MALVPQVDLNADAADGPLKRSTSRGFVLDPDRAAVWGPQYVWPFKADYRISCLSSDYAQTVITREKRDHVWIMARTPRIPGADLRRLIDFVGSQGYDVSRIQRVPQDAGRQVPTHRIDSNSSRGAPMLAASMGPHTTSPRRNTRCSWWSATRTTRPGRCAPGCC